MKIRFSLWTMILLFSLLASALACATLTGNEPEALSIAGTEIAAEIFATQTAGATAAADTPEPAGTEAPIDTPVPGDTPQPSDTPQPTATPTETPSPTDTATPPPTDTPEPTSTPLPDVTVTSPSVNLRAGPGLAYDSIGAMQEGDTARVLGQAFDCGWLLVETGAGDEGWITGGAQYVTFNLVCADVAQAVIPPTPTAAASPTPPASATPDRPTIPIAIENNTGGAVFVNLNGPAVYQLTIQAGNHVINVVPGTYSYTLSGCGGATSSGSITFEVGDVWEWWCE